MFFYYKLYAIKGKTDRKPCLKLLAEMVSIYDGNTVYGDYDQELIHVFGKHWDGLTSASSVFATRLYMAN